MVGEAAPSTATVASTDEVPPVDIPHITSKGISSQSSTLSPLQSMSLPPSPSGALLATMEGRLKTFERWPVSFLPAEEMAAAGFYFLNWEDAVKCIYCGAVIKDWELGDEAMGEHRRLSPNCEFVNSRQCGCIDTVFNDTCSSFHSPPALLPRPQPLPMPRVTPVHTARLIWPQYLTAEARLATFNDWPSAIPVEPATLIEAGFFYSGTGDCTICYYCGQRLRDWDPSNDPWVEHELWFPGCWHVLLHKGNDFVRDIAEKRDTLIAAKQNARKTATTVSGESSKSQPAIKALDNQVKEMKNTAIDDKRLCRICYEKDMGVAFLPCGHIMACIDCASSFVICPLCRQPFQDRARIYLPW